MKKIETIEKIKNKYYSKYLKILEVSNSFGNVKEDEINNFLLDIYNELENIDDKALIEKSVERFKEQLPLNIVVNHEIPKLIEKVLNSEEAINVLSSILSNPETLGEHNDTIIDGTFLAANILKTNQVVEFITNYIIIHQSEYKINEFFEKIKNSNINDMNNKKLNSFFYEIIVKSIQSKLNLEDVTSIDNKKKIIDYIENNFIKNGYRYQGINGNFKDDAIKNGLTMDKSNNNIKYLMEVNEIFNRHGLNKIFYSKLDESSYASYYYTTDSMASAYYFSNHNPEYFDYFIASGNNMTDFEYIRAAYQLKEEKWCRDNLIKLCDNYKLSDYEKTRVMFIYQQMAKDFINEKSINKNSLVLVQRKIYNRDILNYDKEKLLNMDAYEIVSTLVSSKEGSTGLKHFTKVEPELIDVIDIPSTRRLYKNNYIKNTKKYIKTSDGNKYYYDILIHADEADYDCIQLDSTYPYLDEMKSNTFKSIDVIHCDNSIKADDIILNGSTSYQSIQMMAAVNGVANSSEGKLFLDNARKNYSPKYMSDYYYHLCKLCCDVLKDEDVSQNVKAAIIYRMARDIYPKAEIMKNTNNYPQIVSETTHINEYMDFKTREQYLKINRLRKKESTITLDSKNAISSLLNYFENNLKGKVNADFKDEFDSKIKKFGLYEKKNMLNLSKNDNSDKKDSFNKRTDSEIQIAQQIRRKNQMIAEKKKTKFQDNKPKTLVKTNPNSHISSNGYVDAFILSLIVSFFAGMLFAIVYFVVR